MPEQDDRGHGDHGAHRRVAEPVHEPEHHGADRAPPPPDVDLAQERPQQRAAEEQLLGDRRQEHDREHEHRDLPSPTPGRRSAPRPAWRCGRRSPRGCRSGSAPPAGGRPRRRTTGRSEDQAPAGRRICRPKSVLEAAGALAPGDHRQPGDDRDVLRADEDDERDRTVRVVGIRPRTPRRPPRPRCPTANGGDGVADPPGAPGGVPRGPPTVTTPAAAGVAAAGAAAEEAEEGAAHCRSRYRCAPRNPRPLAAVDTGEPQPLRSRSVGLRPGRSMERSTTRSRPEDEPPPDRSRTRGRTRRRRDRALPRAQRPNGHPPDSPAVVASRRAPARLAADRRRPAARRRRPSDDPRRPSGGSSPSLRWVPWIVLALIAAAFLVSSLAGSSSSKADLTYSQFVNGRRRRQRQEHRLQQVDRRDQRQVHRAAVDGKTEFSSSGPKDDLPDADARRRSRRRTSTSTTSTTGSNLLGDILLWVLPLVLIIGFFVWMSRRARRARWAR